jgi:hypothetical protein
MLLLLWVLQRRTSVVSVSMHIAQDRLQRRTVAFEPWATDGVI